MKKFSLVTFLYILGLNACTPKGPTVFEVGIFNRDVAQVALNTKKIEKNAKQSERNLEEIKVIKSRVAGDETKPEPEEAPKTEEKEQEKH